MYAPRDRSFMFSKPETETLPDSRRPWLRFTLCALAVLVAVGAWVTWREIWGRPLWISHFYERAFIEVMLDNRSCFPRSGWSTILGSTFIRANSMTARLQLLSERQRVSGAIWRCYGSIR